MHRPALRRSIQPLATRNYRFLISAVALQVFGTGVWSIVMVFQVLALNDSPVVLSGVAAAMSLGLFAFSIVGGVVADRFDRRRTIITVQGATAAVMTITASLALAGAIQLWQVAMAAFCLGAGSAFFYPAYSSYLPRVLPPEQLLAANGLEGAVRPTFGQGLGPALGGIVVGAFFPGAGAVLVAAAHLAAFVLTLFLSRAETPASTSDGSAERTSVREDLRAGIGYVLRTRWLLWTLIFGSANALIIQGPIEVLLPFITRQHFADPEATYGFLMAGYGVGGAVGSLIVSAMRLPGRYLTFMLACWGGGTLPLVVIGAAEHQAPMLVALFVAGAATSGGVVIWGTLLQRLVPPEMIGRVASLDFFVSIAFMPVSIAIAGPLSLVIPVDVIFLLAGLLPPVFALVAMVAGRMNATQVANPLDVGSEGGRTREG